MPRIISPSLLSADFGHLDRDMRAIDASDAQWIHIDIMDGVFVPNISFGFPVLKAIRRATRKPLDVHLMIVEPEKYLVRFAEAGADWLTFHYEASADPMAAVRTIHQAGMRAGISIKPATPPEVLEPLLPHLDLVLVMSVEPGFGSQKFMPASLDKVRWLRERIDTLGLSALIEIDGGVNTDNAATLFAAGCDALVAGSAVFNAPDPAIEIRRLLEA